MFEILFDIKPDTGQVRITIRLACLMNERGNKVYYTHTSDSVFTAGLLKKGIGRVIYPDDFRWFKPDLALLDAQLPNKAAFYRKQEIDCIFVTLQKTDNRMKSDSEIPIIYLPPVPHPILSETPRMHDFIEKIAEIRQRYAQQTVIIGLMEEENGKADMELFYKAIKRNGIADAHYRFVILTRDGGTEEKLFSLPDNVTVYRMPDLQALLPLCDMALTAGGLNAWIECTFAHVPMLDFSEEAIRKITPQSLNRQIKEMLDNKKHIIEQQKQLCDLYERENGKLDETADWLINRIKQKRK